MKDSAHHKVWLGSATPEQGALRHKSSWADL